MSKDIPEFTKLRSSDSDVAFTTIDTILTLFTTRSKSWIMSQIRSLIDAEEFLLHSHVCLVTHLKESRIIILLMSLYALFAESYTETAKTMWKLGLFPSLCNVLKCYPHEASIVMVTCKVLNLVCEVEKKAGLLLRLQGVLPGIVDVLKYFRGLQLEALASEVGVKVHGHSVKALKTLKAVFELLDHALKSTDDSSSSNNVSTSSNTLTLLHKLQCVPLMLGLLTDVHPPSILFTSSCVVLERFAMHEKSSDTMVQCGIINWIFKSLETNRMSPKGTLSIIKLCKNLCKHISGKGAKELIERGGFECFLPYIFKDSSTIKAAGTLLWAFQILEFSHILDSAPLTHVLGGLSYPPYINLSSFMPLNLVSCSNIFSSTDVSLASSNYWESLTLAPNVMFIPSSFFDPLGSFSARILLDILEATKRKDLSSCLAENRLLKSNYSALHDFSMLEFLHLNLDSPTFLPLLFCPELWLDQIENHQFLHFLSILSSVFSRNVILSDPLLENFANENNASHDSLPNLVKRDGSLGIDSSSVKEELLVPEQLAILCSMIALSARMKHPYSGTRLVFERNGNFSKIDESDMIFQSSPVASDLANEFDFQTENSEAQNFTANLVPIIEKLVGNGEIPSVRRSYPSVQNVVPPTSDVSSSDLRNVRKSFTSFQLESTPTAKVKRASFNIPSQSLPKFGVVSPEKSASIIKKKSSSIKNQSLNLKKGALKSIVSESDKISSSPRDISNAMEFDNLTEVETMSVFSNESNLESFDKDVDADSEIPSEKVSVNVNPLSSLLQTNYLNLQSEYVRELDFESRFESGNLFSATRVAISEYDLLLTPDTNTNGHTQWFCFRVRNMVRNVRYRFHVNNFEKPASAFNLGMRPVMYSAKTAEAGFSGWSRCGEDICYYKNFTKRPARKTGSNLDCKSESKSRPSSPTCSNLDDDSFYFTLSFSIIFTHSEDSVFLSYCYPFTYSFQSQWLDYLCFNNPLSCNIRRQPLCFSRGGNLCEILTITDFGGTGEQIKNRPLVILTGRVHPGETNASWVVKGIVDFLVSNDAIAIKLRQSIVFKIVPMLNPDGVIHGNYRCSLMGCDLNRRWKSPNEHEHPTIFNSKRLIKLLAADRPVLLFCDFHGHSIIKDVVLYGCDSAESTIDDDGAVAADSSSDEDELLLSADKSSESVVLAGKPVLFDGDFSWVGMRGRERLFPALLFQRAPQYFNLDRCTFRVTSAKAGASRVAIWRELNLINCFTLEASFCGSSSGDFANMHYDTNDFESIGKNFCLSLMDLIDPEQIAVQAAWSDVNRIRKKTAGTSKSKKDPAAIPKKSIKAKSLK